VAPGDRRFRLVWAVAWPLRIYLRHTPLKLGRTFLIWHVLAALTPKGDRTFLAKCPDGSRVRLRYSEVVGFLMLVQGSFERAEVETMIEAARPGTVAVDVGAHVGIFTVPLAHAVGAGGSVWAFEPQPENLERLQANLAENHRTNVSLFGAAASDADGGLLFHVADDSAYGSTGEVLQGRGTVGSLKVQALRLDTVWKGDGMRPVSVVKIDVEGAELAVLRGAQELIRRCRPVLLVETATSDQLAEIERYLSALGYEKRDPKGFAARNHLFVPFERPAVERPRVDEAARSD
jgi:FkbM family methyltransferase